MNVGAHITNSHAFTSIIGAHFAAGEVFEITIVGSHNIQAVHLRTGSVVWLRRVGDTPRFATDADLTAQWAA